MELSYFYDQINESDDFKSIFSLVDKNLESLVSDIQEVVNEASNPDDEPKKYNETIKKHKLSKDEKMMKRAEKTKAIILKAKTLLNNIIRTIKMGFYKIKKFITDKIDSVLYGKGTGEMSSSTSNALIPAGFDYKRGVLKMMEVLSPFIDGMSSFIKDVVSVDYEKEANNYRTAGSGDGFSKKFRDVMNYDSAEIISNKEYNNQTIKEVNVMIFTGFFGTEKERINASEFKSNIDVKNDKSKILGCISKIESEILKGLNKIQMRFDSISILGQIMSIIVGKVATSAKMISNICTMASKSYGQACKYQSLINKAYYENPSEYKDVDDKNDKKEDNNSKSLSLVKVKESLNDLVEEYETETDKYLESIGYPSYQEYLLEAMVESFKIMDVSTLLETENTDENKKEDTENKTKAEPANGEQSKISIKNKIQMLIKKIQILLQKFGSMINMIIQKVSDVITSSFTLYTKFNQLPQDFMNDMYDRDGKAKSEQNKAKQIVVLACDKIQNTIFGDMEEFIDNVDEAASKPFNIDMKPTPIDIVFKRKFKSMSDYVDSVNLKITGNDPAGRGYRIELDPSKLKDSNIFKLKNAKKDFEKGIRGLQNKVNSLLRKITARSKQAVDNNEFGYCVTLVTACSALMALIQRSGNLIRAAYRKTQQVLVILTNAFGVSKDKVKKDYADAKEKTEKTKDFNKQEKEEREQREKDFKNKTGQYAEKKEAKQESFLEDQGKNRIVSKNVSNILSKLY